MSIKKNLLIVDDESAVLNALQRDIFEEGYNILTANNGNEGLEKLKGNKIQVILSDIRMPEMDGVAFFQKARSISPDSIRIALSAYTEVSVLIAAINRGEIWRFLAKPWDAGELKMTLRQAFEYHNLLTEKENLTAQLRETNIKLNTVNKYLDNKLQKSTKDLADSLAKLDNLNTEMIHRLLIAAEYRDDQTGRHITRVGKYARIIAENIQDDRLFINMLEQTAPMHDIGKIGISDTILLKPGKLTDTEFNQIKTHVTIGARILDNSAHYKIKMAYEIALYHHEKWNGRGYVNSLAGEAIPLSARITAVADVFDAITSARPYKKATPFAEGVMIIQQEVGSHFDPKCIDAFMTGLPEIERVYNKFKDTPEGLMEL